MKRNKIRVKIKTPIEKAFAFSLDPKNTPLWLDDIMIEITSNWPVKKGTIYKNKNKNGQWSKYILKDIKKNKSFEFITEDGNYHCCYTFTPKENNSCDLEYCEWVDRGEITDPFTDKPLEKLKECIEKSSK